MTLRPHHLAIVSPLTLGHLNPLIALGVALERLGHRVTLVHHAEVGRLLADAPIAFEPLGGAHRGDMLDGYLARLARPSGPIGLLRMIRATAQVTGMLLDGLPDTLTRIGTEAVIADAAEPAGIPVARHLGLPLVTAVTGLPLMPDPGVPPPFVPWPYRPGPAGERRNAGGYAVARLLMRPITRRVTAFERRRAVAGAQGSAGAAPLVQVAQCPAALDFPRTALPATFRYGRPWRLPELDDAPLPSDGRPLVFCSLGTLQGSRTRLFAAMTRACAAVGARAVVAHGGGLSEAAARALPGDPLVGAFWPQRAVLRQCAAAILHGGFNSVLDALDLGVPIVALPIAFEQPATAARLAWVGAGVVVPVGRAGVDTLARAVRQVLGEPSYRAAARRMQAAMAGPDGATEAAARISAALQRA